MGQDWLYQFTNNLTNLTLANGGALTQFGLSLLSFIALMMLVNMVVNWGASTMTMTLQTQPVYFGDLIQFLIRLAVCCLLETYWVNPLPAPLYLAAEEHRKLFIPRKRNFHSYVAPSIMWHRYSPMAL